MTFIKAYEELWESRHMKMPIHNIDTFSMVELQELVNRSWRTERNLKQPHPVPVSHVHNRTENLSLHSPMEECRNYLCIAKGKFLFSRIGEKLACDIVLDQGRIEHVWMSDDIPSQLEVTSRKHRHIRSSSYFEDDKEILLAITEG